MRIFLLVFITTYLFADIKYIIEDIKSLEKYEYKIKPFVNYNIFTHYTKPKKRKFSFIKKIFKKHLKLEAIINNKAVINGKMLSIGENISGYKLIEIYDNYVILKKGNKFLKLGFKTNIIGASQ